MDYCNNFRYDLKVGQVGEKLLNDILTLKTIEVKRDSWIYKSGNIAIEFESRSKPSGIAKSEAEYWAIIFSGDYKDEIILIIKIERTCVLVSSKALKPRIKIRFIENATKPKLRAEST